MPSFISVTRLRLRSPRYLPKFYWYALQANLQARHAPGNLGFASLADENLAFWTKTAWKDEASMREFMASGAHRRSMPVLKEICDEASGVSWSQESPTLPEWDEAHERLQQGARYVFVRHPSANQTRQRSDAPRG